MAPSPAAPALLGGRGPRSRRVRTAAGGRMNAAQIERLDEHLGRLRLFKSRERLEALLQDAAARELAYADFLEQVLTEEVASKTSKNVTMRTSLARFPFVKGARDLRLRLPALDSTRSRSKPRHLPLHRARRECRHPRPARRRQDPPRRRSRPQGHRARLPRAVHHRRRHDRHAHQARSPKGRLDEKLKSTPCRGCSSSTRSATCRSTGSGANLFFQLISRRYETRPDDPHQQPELRRLGRGVRRPRDRHRDPGSACSITRSPSTSAATPTGSRRSSRPASSVPKRPKHNQGGEFSIPTAGEIWVPVDTKMTPKTRELFEVLFPNFFPPSGPPTGNV